MLCSLTKGTEKMANEYSYGWEKLYSAVNCLIGPADQRERLAGALLALHVLAIKPYQHLPKDIQAEFAEFWKEMNSVEAEGDEGTIRATVNSLDAAGLRRATEKILHFYDTVCRYQEPFWT
jgi:hypothetical protein